MAEKVPSNPDDNASKAPNIGPENLDFDDLFSEETLPLPGNNILFPCYETCHVHGKKAMFKHINSVQLDRNFMIVCSLEWVEGVHFNTDPQIPVVQLTPSPEVQQWVRRFNVWSQKYDPIIEEAYTWEDLSVDVYLEPEMQLWLFEHHLNTFTTFFTINECLSIGSLMYLTNDMLQQWGLDPVLRRYILKCIQGLNA